MFAIFFLRILTKEGLITTLAPGSSLFVTLRNYGLVQSLSQITIFSLVHLNQSKYIGLSKVDSFQYTMIRSLVFVIQFAVIWRSDYQNTLKYHFEQLLLAILYLAYTVFVDYSNSRKNQLSHFFEQGALGDRDTEWETETAEATQVRTVLIMYRANGRGGVQGIIIDSFYENKDGRIANEFWVITDSDEGTIHRLDDSQLTHIQDTLLIQKTWKRFFLQAKP
jgi:hypothetical protein